MLRGKGGRGGAIAGEVRYAIKIFSWSNKAARARDSERAIEREGKRVRGGGRETKAENKLLCFQN